LLPSVPKFKEDTKFKSYTSTEILQKHTPHLLTTSTKREMVLTQNLEMEIEPNKNYTLQSPHLQLVGH